MVLITVKSCRLWRNGLTDASIDHLISIAQTSKKLEWLWYVSNMLNYIEMLYFFVDSLSGDEFSESGVIKLQRAMKNLNKGNNFNLMFLYY